MPKQGDVKIDTTMPALTGNVVKYRVYHWTERPDADNHIKEDRMHWCLDSEHATEDEAVARMKALKGGAKAHRLSDDLHAKSQRKVN